MDLREGSYGDPKRVWGELYHPAHVSRVERALGLSLQKSQRLSLSSAMRGGHRQLQRKEVAFSQKRGR
jgi:hypothetical protein